MPAAVLCALPLVPGRAEEDRSPHLRGRAPPADVSTPAAGSWSPSRGPRHAGKLVTVIIEDTCYRILHGEEELAVKSRKDTSPITRLYVRGMKTQA